MEGREFRKRASVRLASRGWITLRERSAADHHPRERCRPTVAISLMHPERRREAGAGFGAAPTEEVEYALAFDRRRGIRCVADLTKEKLTDSPRFNRGDEPNWTDPAFGRRIDDHYGSPPI